MNSAVYKTCTDLNLCDREKFVNAFYINSVNLGNWLLYHPEFIDWDSPLRLSEFDYNIDGGYREGFIDIRSIDTNTIFVYDYETMKKNFSKIREELLE